MCYKGDMGAKTAKPKEKAKAKPKTAPKPKTKAKAKAKHPDYPRDENGELLPYVIVLPGEKPPTDGRPYLQLSVIPRRPVPTVYPEDRSYLPTGEEWLRFIEGEDDY